MELEKKLNCFNYTLDGLKEESVFKKSVTAKRDIWKDLKKQERMRLKKEQEELEKKMQGG